MKDKIAKLIDLKSIVTLIVVIVYSALVITKTIPADGYKEIVLIVMTFYFAKQNKKEKSTNDTTNIVTSNNDINDNS